MKAKSKYYCYLWLAVSCLSFACQRLSVDDLRCEYLSRPEGLDVAVPRFSWIITANSRAVYQTAYRILVSDNLSDIRNKRGNCWDSGQQESGNTIHLEYAGTALSSNRTYYWRVCSLIDGKEIWSKPAVFRTGLLHPDDWKAQWISTKEELIHASPLLRNDFVLEKNVEEARLYVTAAGFYEVYLNGSKVGDDKMHPAISDFRKTVLYSVYDVSRLLKKGDNALGIMLGNSAYNIRKSDNRYGWGGDQRMGNPCVSLQMQVIYDDGSQTVVTTGDGWKYTFGPITYNNIYGGEDYDARKEIPGWASAGFNDAEWHGTEVVRGPGGIPRWQSVPIKVTETLTPVAVTKPAKGVYLFDLGQNIAGWWRMELKGHAGQTVRVRGAETLNNNLFPKKMEQGDSLSTKFDYHARVWTDYTLKSDRTESYEPHFFYTGCRYIEVTVADGQELEALKVEGRVLRSDIEQSGEWTSSHPLLNWIHTAGLWSQKANLVGYPTDCPHREKGAYNGDGQVIAESSMHDFRMAPFYYKWLNDMRDSQEPGGRIPNTSPPIVGGMGGGIAWGSAYVLIPWWMYHYYDDIRVLREHYPSMKQYLNYLRNLARNDEKPDEPYIINYFDGYWYSLGEWCSPGRSDCPNHDVVSTFYYYYDAQLMSKIAELLGHSDDARHYLALSDTIRQAFNERFFSEKTLLYGSDTTYQTYQLLALVGNLVPEAHRNGVLNTVVEDIRNRGNHLNTGIIGTKYLWPALSDNGFDDLACSVALQESYPGYGFWYRNHCTTLLELWEGNFSHNHQMFGAITEYLYRYPAGIDAPTAGKTTNGYRHIRLQPRMIDSLQTVRASLQTMSGQIISEWKRCDNQYTCEVLIPANTTAIAVLPVDGKQRLTESGNTIWQNGIFTAIPGVDDVKAGDGGLWVSLLSGKYKFQWEK
ncbi:MAG: glycoside hydrolase family 78 protein [Dysgonamonadaceae bacterium]|jgi:alpha-L-rhamnosidase|nr:glycoside hydrolase family 78 protein [Dysgonamonadaceae bacterium]